VLRPQRNGHRDAIELNGVWEAGLDDGRAFLLAVPASWNEQHSALRHHQGSVTYRRSVWIPSEWRRRDIVCRLDAAAYRARVWCNGRLVGEGSVGYLPAEFDLAAVARFGAENELAIEVDARLSGDTVPQGGIGAFGPFGRQYPDVPFDFYPYGGLHRPVWLHARPVGGLSSLQVETELDGTIRVSAAAARGTRARLTIDGRHAEAPSRDATIRLALRLRRPRLWSPADPHLYRARVELLDGDRAIDEYAFAIGIRRVAIDGDMLLLNDQPIRLRGFGRHEDFPLVGRGELAAQQIRDFDLMRWTGANSFRTSHYPYSETMLDLADRLGFLVIAESAAVSLHIDDHPALLPALREQLTRLVERDRNHPSVILWSVANEPVLRADSAARAFFADVVAHVRQLDASRPVTFAAVMGTPPEDEVFELFDVVALNRYWGWYALGGEIEPAMQALGAEMDMIHDRCRKPVLLSEFGADAMAGLHTEPAEVWSEEYQAELIDRTCDVAEGKAYCIGTHVWNFADFATAQAFYRVVGNRKGVFTRTREPKLAAHRLRARWTRV
jgi:beta-glucuronidase